MGDGRACHQGTGRLTFRKERGVHANLVSSPDNPRFDT